MTEKSEVLQGTLDLMVLKTLHALGPQHGFGIARRIEQISEQSLKLNEGTVYTSLLRLQQQAGFVLSGVYQRTIAEHGFIRSPNEDKSSWQLKRRIGRQSRGSLGVFSAWRGKSNDV